MQEEKKFLEHIPILKKFLMSRKKIPLLLDADKKLVNGIHYLIRIIPKYVDPAIQHRFSLKHGLLFDNLYNAQTHHDKKLHSILNETLSGGSFFGDIGHFFSHAASSVGHAFKHAYEGVKHLGQKAIHGVKNIGEKAVHGIEHAGETVYHGVKDVGEKAVHGIEEGIHDVGQFFKGVSNDVVDAADIAIDAINAYGPQALATALPYIEKGLNIGVAALANSVVPGSGVFVSKGLSLAEQAANPIIKQKLNSLNNHGQQEEEEGGGFHARDYHVHNRRELLEAQKEYIDSHPSERQQYNSKWGTNF